MKILESAENYMEAIHILNKEKGQVRAIDIAHYLNFSKPSVSIAMKQLEQNGYIKRDADGHISLTAEGENVAVSIFKRHKLLTDLFLAIGVSEETAKDDACKVEHHISQETFECLQKEIDKIKSAL
ncbi:MAG: metal-dependent transcriptional regulator [Bacillota bacterium]|nr:metal-dependent transcriptional regulator [Bacillota bacterium]